MAPARFAEKALRGLARGHTEIRPGGARMLYVLGRLAPRRAFRLLNRLAS
jgi:hypothetical protein